MVALTNETPRIPALPRALATDAANRLDELEAEVARLRAKLDEYVNEAVALEISRAALEERTP
jgi:uncharacterized protein YceH (UPF0502 family)